MEDKWEEIVKRFDIRKMYQDARMENISHLPPAMIEFAKKWIDAKKKPSLFLTGSVGSGKTYFMTALMRALLEKGHTWVRFTRSVDLFEELLQCALNHKSNHTLLRNMCEVPFLFLDDVGVESLTDRVKKEYFAIIDYRISEMLPFVMTSNFTKSEFGKMLGDRVESRMFMSMEIVFPKTDLRKEINFYKI